MAVGDISNLPKWVQTYIEAREQEIKDLKRHVEDLSVGPEESDVFVRHFDYPDQPLGRGVTVEFALGDHFSEGFSVRVETTTSRERMPGDKNRNTGPVVEEKFLSVSSNGNSIRIAPRSGNAVRIYLAD